MQVRILPDAQSNMVVGSIPTTLAKIQIDVYDLARQSNVTYGDLAELV